MKDIFERHIEMVEAVNNSKNETEHYHMELRLSGFRDCLDTLGYSGFRMEADNFYMDQGIDRPMCCGVFIDWEPETK